jgi:hypothetical protein
VSLTRECSPLFRLRWLGALALAAYASTVGAADWSTCHDDLDTLRRAASDASDAAEEMDQAAQDLESKKDDMESALRYLRLCSRDCWYERSRYNSAKADYESAKDDFESKKSDLASGLDEVASRVRDVEFSCNYTIVSGAAGRSPTNDRFCALLRRYKGLMNDQVLMETCRKSRSEEDCRKCLN